VEGVRGEEGGRGGERGKGVGVREGMQERGEGRRKVGGGEEGKREEGSMKCTCRHLRQLIIVVSSPIVQNLVQCALSVSGCPSNPNGLKISKASKLILARIQPRAKSIFSEAARMVLNQLFADLTAFSAMIPSKRSQ
jgi:hypothetical protein